MRTNTYKQTVNTHLTQGDFNSNGIETVDDNFIIQKAFHKTKNKKQKYFRLGYDVFVQCY